MVRRYIGIDTGGTFTDCVELDGYGKIFFDKAFSTPRQPEEAIMNVLAQIAEEKSCSVREVLETTERFAHGSTVSTNALIERKGATGEI